MISHGIVGLGVLHGSGVTKHLRPEAAPVKDMTLTPHQYQTQVRFWIPLKIATYYDYMMPRLPENAKNKIP